MHYLRIFTAVLTGITAAAAQSNSYTIRTFAGVTRDVGDNGPAIRALLWSPRGVAVDGGGNLYIADTLNARVRRVTPDGTIRTVAGYYAGYSGDGGPAASAYVAFPSKAVVAPSGDLYVADSANHRIRRISASGVITTLAGTGVAGYAGDDSTGAAAQFSFPRDVAVSAGGDLYIADTNNSRIRRITAQGRVSTVAGAGIYGFQGDDGPATRAYLAGPRGVALDAAGNLYIADTLNHRVRKVSTDGTITTLAGSNEAGYSGDGASGTYARLNTPTSVAVDRAGNVYIADSGNHRVRRINAQGIITTVAGTGVSGFSGDNGAAALAQLNAPQSVAVDASGALFIADTENHRVRTVDARGVISTVAGSDPGAGDGGAALSARLFQPGGIALDGAGNVYVSDTLNHRVRKIDAQGVISTVAGTGSAGYSGDNRAAAGAQLNSPSGLALDRGGSLYIADTGNHAIRRVAGGVITTVAGTGEAGKDGDSGPPGTARLFNPSAVAVDPNGTLYIADSGNNRVRVVSGGVIRNYAGDPAGLPGSSGDGGPAVSATFNYPIALALDNTGNLYISDYFNNRIRRVTPGGGTVTTFAGTGVAGAAGDGMQAAQAQFNLPAGIAFDSSRNLYVADLLNSRIRVVGANGVVRTIAGSGTRGDWGDGGSALDAWLLSPRDLAVDALGKVYFADQDNHRIRLLSPASVSIRTVVNAASGIAGSIAPGEAIAIYGTQLGASVTFDGVPATVLYASTQQVNAIVPRSVEGRTLSQLRVSNGDLGSDVFTFSVREAAPGLFTLDGSGSGPAAVINQDGTINGPDNPAPRGSIVSIYGTGNGTRNDAVVRILGLPCEVLFAGETAPGLFQVNARIPLDAPASQRAPVEVIVGSYAAQPSATIAIR